MANKQELTVEDLAKIHVGQKFSSQKELFEILGLECSAGNTRKSAKRTVDQYMRLDIKKKNDITITEIYDEPLLRDDKRTEKEYEMNDEIENLLYSYLKSFPQSTITKRKLAYTLKCFSLDAYIILSRKDISAIANDKGIDSSLIRLYKEEVDYLCDRRIINRLKKFADKGRIKFFEVIAVGENYYDVSSTEYMTYIEKQNELVKKYGFDSYRQVLLSQKSSKFHEEFNEILDEYDLKGAYRAYRLETVSFKPKNKLENRQRIMTSVNEYFTYKLQSRIFRRIENLDKKIDEKYNSIYENGDELTRILLDSNSQIYRKSQILGEFNYPENAKELSNILLNITLNSDVKLFPECAVEKESFYRRQTNS